MLMLGGGVPSAHHERTSQHLVYRFNKKENKHSPVFATHLGKRVNMGPIETVLRADYLSDDAVVVVGYILEQHFFH